MTVVINMLSGPGSGKSTLAAELFVNMKKMGYSVEYLQEYPKKLVWQQKFETLNNQHYVSRKYYESIKAMIGHVDYIILDSSLVNGIWYNRYNPDNVSNVEKTEQMILEKYNSCNNLNFFIYRGQYSYERKGRTQTEEEAKIIDKEIVEILTKQEIFYNPIFMSNDNVVEKMIKIIRSKNDISN